MSKTDFETMIKSILDPKCFYYYYGAADYVVYALVNYQFDKFKLYVDSSVDINQIPELIDVVINSEKFDYANELISRLDSESVRQVKRALIHLTLGEFLEAYHMYQVIDETTLEYPAAYYNGFGYCQAVLGDYDSVNACLEAACKVPKEKRRGVDLSSYNTAMLHAFIPYAQGDIKVASVRYYKLLTSIKTKLHPMCYRLNMVKSMLAKCYLFSHQWEFATKLICDINNYLREAAGWYNRLDNTAAVLYDIVDLGSKLGDHDSAMVSLADYIRNTKCLFWREEIEITFNHFTHDVAALEALRDHYYEQYSPGFYRIGIISKLLQEEIVVPERLTRDKIKKCYQDQWVALTDIESNSDNPEDFESAIVVCGMNDDEYKYVPETLKLIGKEYYYFTTSDKIVERSAEYA